MLSSTDLEVGRGAVHPRALFERRLSKICERLDACSQVEVPPSVRRGWDPGGEFRVERLWVYGSFARGSLECGDLDALVEYKRVGGFGMPGAAPVMRALGAAPPLVRFTAGAPQDSGNENVQADAVLVWERGAAPGSWRERLAAIKPNPLAGRAPRKTQSIPLRHEQIHSGIDMAALADRHSGRELEWEFVPWELPPLRVRRTNKLADEIMLEWLAKLLQDRGFAGETEQVLWHKEGESYRWRGYVAALRSRGSNEGLWDLDHGLCRCVIIAPEFSARGPNGAWLIRRGLAPILFRYEEKVSADASGAALCRGAAR